jgi:sensor histidine kinase YesM
LFAAGRQSWRSALASGVVGVAPAALLSGAVWRLCRRLRWPERINAAFYLAHLGLASVYAAIWVGAVRLTGLSRAGHLIPREFLSSRIVMMQFLTGIALYGVIAGVSYAIQISRQLRDKEQLAERARTLAMSARLEALSARLHPHFLFNALHTLAALMRYNPSVSETAIERLGEMLRYALRTDGEAAIVSFPEEWAFTMKYLDFQKLRFGDRLGVRVELDENTAAWRIPSFAVQTLVENAVVHAVELNPKGGTVCLAAVVEHGRLVVTVRDEGGGSRVSIGRGSGQGLAGLRERLAALYGPAASVSHTTTPSNGFEVRLVLSMRAPAIAGLDADE